MQFICTMWQKDWKGFLLEDWHRGCPDRDVHRGILTIQNAKMFNHCFSPNLRVLQKLQVGLASKWDLVVVKYMRAGEKEKKCKIDAKENVTMT